MHALLLHHIMFIFGFVFFLNTAAEAIRYKSPFFYADWWNTKWNFNFWQRWNVIVHMFFKRHVIWPLDDRKYPAHFSRQLVFFISGFMHEYIVAMVFMRFDWVITLDFVVQYPVGLVQAFVLRKLGIKNQTILYLGFYFYMFVICHALMFLHYDWANS